MNSIQSFFIQDRPIFGAGAAGAVFRDTARYLVFSDVTSTDVSVVVLGVVVVALVLVDVIIMIVVVIVVIVVVTLLSSLHRK